MNEFPWSDADDRMPLPSHFPDDALTGCRAATEAWCARRDARREKFFATPEGAAWLAADEAARRTRAETARRDKSIWLRARAIERGVPDNPKLLEIATDPDPPESMPMRALSEAFRWSDENDHAQFVRFLCGPVGTGKSAALAHVVATVKRPALYVRAARLFDVPRNAYSDNAARWSEWLEVPLLAIDEIGTERADAKNLPMVRDLIVERYDAGHITLLSGNLGVGDVHSRYQLEADDRFVSRVADEQGHDGAVTGLPFFVTVTGPSLRVPANRAALPHHESPLRVEPPRWEQEQPTKAALLRGIDTAAAARQARIAINRHRSDSR